MKPPMAYYGGKTRLAPWIVSLMPAHRVYVEPFAGSAAVLFAKTPARHEIINDLDDDVVNFFRVLRERPDEIEIACRLTPYARTEYSHCAGTDPTVDDLERARRWWVRSSQSFAKVANVGTGWATSIERGSNNARSAWNRLSYFALAANRLGGVVIECRDALDVIDRYDAADGVIYADPPYLGATRTSIAGGRRPNGDYTVEYHTEAQHRTLAEALTTARATVLISGYPSPLYEGLYRGWHRVARRVVRRTSNGRSSALPHVTEVVWSNRPLIDRLPFDSTAECAP